MDTGALIRGWAAVAGAKVGEWPVLVGQLVPSWGKAVTLAPRGTVGFEAGFCSCFGDKNREVRVPFATLRKSFSSQGSSSASQRG